MIFSAILEKHPPPASRVNAEVPPRLDDVIAKALDAAFLQDGISIGVTNALSELSGLKVMSSSASQSYAGKNADPQKVGRELKVDAVLIGRVEQRGDTISIAAELVNASDSSQIWGRQYREKMADAAALQQEIVRDISDTLRVRLNTAEKARLYHETSVFPRPDRFASERIPGQSQGRGEPGHRPRQRFRRGIYGPGIRRAERMEVRHGGI